MCGAQECQLSDQGTHWLSSWWRISVSCLESKSWIPLSIIHSVMDSQGDLIGHSKETGRCVWPAVASVRAWSFVGLKEYNSWSNPREAFHPTVWLWFFLSHRSCLPISWGSTGHWNDQLLTGACSDICWGCDLATPLILVAQKDYKQHYERTHKCTLVVSDLGLVS